MSTSKPANATPDFPDSTRVGAPVDLFTAFALTAPPDMRAALGSFEINDMPALYRRMHILPSGTGIIDYTLRTTPEQKPVTERLVCSFGDGRFSLVHLRDSGSVVAEGQGLKPFFLQLSHLHGSYTSDGQARAAVTNLVHPYGATKTTPANPADVDYFRALRSKAESAVAAPR